MSRTVVIVSSAEDLHARAVTRRIKEISSGAAQVVLLDCATFPIGSSLSVRLSASIISSSILHTAPLPNPHSSNARVYLKQAGVSELAGSDIRSIWWRRPRKPLPPDYGGDLLEA